MKSVSSEIAAAPQKKRGEYAEYNFSLQHLKQQLLLYTAKRFNEIRSFLPRCNWHIKIRRKNVHTIT